MTFLTLVLKISAVLAAAWISSRALRNCSASVRHLVWATALAIAILLPAVSYLLPAWSPAQSVSAAIVAIPAPSANEGALRTPPPPVSNPIPWPALLWSAWGAGAAVIAVRFIRGATRVSRLLNGSINSTFVPMARALARSLGIRRSVRVFESGEAAVPMAWGTLHPVVILPSSASTWPADRLRSVLLHELMHISRFDLTTQVLAQVACCLYWFNPLAWLAARNLRDERERACDDAVLRLGVAPADYAGHLLELARDIPSGASYAPAMAEGSELETRVQALLDRTRDRRPVGRLSAAVGLAASFALLVGIAAFRAEAQPARGTLAGVVKDPSGGVIPNCSITAKNLTGTNQEVSSANAAGEYLFTAIPSGRYQLEFRASGFRMLSKEVPVEADQAARADVTLEVGGVSEKLVVTGKRPSTPMPSVGTPRRIRVGGNVQATRVVTTVRPAYPPQAMQKGIEGSVLLRAVISVDGSLLNVEVANTAVHPDLAKAAIEAVRQWRYQPTLLNGQPVEVVTTITVEFRLES